MAAERVTVTFFFMTSLVMVEDMLDGWKGQLPRPILGDLHYPVGENSPPTKWWSWASDLLAVKDNKRLLCYEGELVVPRRETVRVTLVRAISFGGNDRQTGSFAGVGFDFL